MPNREEQRELLAKATKEIKNLSKEVKELKKKRDESEKKIEYLRAQLAEKEMMVRP